MNAFVKALRFVGDLDDEFYDDERQRDVWNEASAIGFQLFQWASLVSAAVLPWVAGSTGAWVGLGILVTLTVINVLTIGYSAARKVNLYTASKINRVRGLVVAVVLVIGYVGALIRVQPDTFSDASSWAGGVVGAVVGGGVVGLGVWWMRRRNARFEAEADQ
ncbi:DUF2029 domain-containing protein [Rhodococcus sp. 14-2470-1b]|uniref:DUF2029 domain-containing protein n=1 Tax=Rhodococcus sp. 14-2470-1b TaxID=2023149 RepID=UPI000B9B0D46|nr:DUF2029 domain-containing protein [Rhodococcus sp. 14-2470-1b]OZF50927.1 DUF2029 domain-containing protein [Rhodococcus sp. 14-2470-1b]